MRTIEELPIVVVESINRILLYIQKHTDATEEELEIIATHLAIAYVLGYNVAPAFVENLTADQSSDLVNAFAEFYGDYLTKAVEYRDSATDVPYAMYYTICTTFMIINGFYEYVREYCPDLRLAAEDFINNMSEEGE